MQKKKCSGAKRGAEGDGGAGAEQGEKPPTRAGRGRKRLLGEQEAGGLLQYNGHHAKSGFLHAKTGTEMHLVPI